MADPHVTMSTVRKATNSPAKARMRAKSARIPVTPSAAEIKAGVLPPLSGRPIRVFIRRSLGPHLAATSIPKRLILLDAEVLAVRGDFERILVHEIFHFVWVRLSNAARRSWEQILAQELKRKAAGELGWSAEWRKTALHPSDVRARSPRWLRYACESFCDTAAWLYAGLRTHNEFTLAASVRPSRRAWFKHNLTGDVLI